MNLKNLGTLSAITGVFLASFTGNAIARYAGFGEQSWLIAAFALGILLLSHRPVLRLQQGVRDLQARSTTGTDGQRRV